MPGLNIPRIVISSPSISISFSDYVPDNVYTSSEARQEIVERGEALIGAALINYYTKPLEFHITF